ncbi:MAG: adenylate/guanylate cyclase domain-containing protein [Actinomycetota bacterium]
MSIDGTMHDADPDPTDGAEIGPLPGFLLPVVDMVARIRATVHTKLLAGFLVIAVLLLSMGVVSIVILDRVNDQVTKLTALSDQVNQARKMIYEVTAQSHYRAMALLTRDPSWTDKIYTAKSDFASNLAEIRTYAVAAQPQFFDALATANQIYAESSDRVTKLYQDGEIHAALLMHIDQEHTQSHVLEDQLNVLIADSQALFVTETESFAAHRQFLTLAVASFSGISLLTALALGAVLSWSVIRPVRRMDDALERIAGGDFDTHIEVPNRDEFGNLTRNLNGTAARLSTVYRDLESLNANLQETVDAKVAEIERVSRLKRYLSPRLAESIIAEEGDLDLAPRRKFLTTFFSDVRGFTAASERMEPEALIDELNDYLSEMTEIVFRWGGTLDKYVGDAVMVFFGDPIRQDDHAERAVRMAFEMRERMSTLQERWLQRYEEAFRIGIGISTGWVTVGDIGSPARTDYTVLGNEVNLASRLSDRADAGQVLVTERTLADVRSIVAATPVDEMTLKGVSRSVRIYEIEPRNDEMGDVIQGAPTA